MANVKKSYYLICYDIEDTKKRTKLSKVLLDYGVRVQKSVFEAYLSEDDFDRMLRGVKPYVTDEDSLRVYELTDQAYQQKVMLGQTYHYDPDEDIMI